MSKLTFVSAAALLALLAASCNGAATVTSTPTPTPGPTSTLAPTLAVAATAVPTPVPNPTPRPTRTSAATVTPQQSSAITPTPEPTAEPTLRIPTTTPVQTRSQPAETLAPAPTPTPSPTPTHTPTPTPTPPPTAISPASTISPTPSPTPAPISTATPVVPVATPEPAPFATPVLPVATPTLAPTPTLEPPTPTQDPVFSITQDGLERGTVSGGVGYWSTPWQLDGQAFILRFSGKGPPRTGRFHLLLRGKQGDARRSVNLTRETDVRLQFWARALSFEQGDNAEAMVCWTRCGDESSWTVIARWTDGDDGDVYRLHTFRLTCEMLTKQFTIRFRTSTTDSDDWLFIDDISLVSPMPAPTFTPVPTPTPTPAPPPPPKPTSVPAPTRQSFITGLSLEDLDISVGTEVTWFNQDFRDHIIVPGTPPGTITAGFKVSPRLKQGDSFSRSFGAVVDIPYFCTLHPDSMVARIQVR